ncbi:MAG: ABC transporter permease [Bryobacteraceae bacterium]
MRTLRNIARWFMRRGKSEQELDSELQFHIECETEVNMRRGMSPEAARRAALVSLGGVEQTKEECRESRQGHTVETVLLDIRYGLRVLRKNPGFSLAAIGILALGIGANTAMFSVVYGVLLRPLPYADGGQLVVLHQKAKKANVADIPFSVKEIQDYRTQSHTLAAVVEHHSMSFLLLTKDNAERVQTAVVSANFFDVLGVRPLLGRTFVASDETHASDAVLILSYDYWMTRHGGDPHIVGQVFQMNNRPHTVIGVLPSIPQYPVESDVYMPTSQCPTRSSERFMANRQARMMTVFGRLKPDVTVQQAQADLDLVSSNIEVAYPDVYPKSYGYAIGAAPLRDDLTRRARTTFLVLLAAAGLVLLIACANVANLMLARLLKLERELAVRAALGASRIRLVRQSLTESMLLSFAGGLAGLALAPFALQILVNFAQRFTTRAAEVRIDAPVLAFAFGASLLTGLVFGLAPALWSGREAGDSLRQSGTRTTAGPARQRLRAVLVMAQVAVSFVLLIGAGLTIRSLMHLIQEDPGFRTDRLLTMRLTANLPNSAGHKEYYAFSRNVLDRLSQAGQVESVALASNLPLSRRGIVSGPGDNEFQIEGRPISKGELAPRVDLTVVSDKYFETIRQPLVAGRYLTIHDNEEAPAVAVINNAMARHRWPNEDPIGKRVSFDHGERWLQIVGVVGNVKEYGLQLSVGDELYLPLAQGNFGGNFVLRTTQDPASVITEARNIVRQIDPHIAIDEVATMERLRSESVASPRLTALLMAMFAGLALLMSASGIAAVMALSVSQRTHELGIRMALGARREALLQSIVLRGVALALAGCAVGLAGSLAFTQSLSTLLFGVSPTDPLTFLAVSVLFMLVAAAASFLPARQVTAIDPVQALRQE